MNHQMQSQKPATTSVLFDFDGTLVDTQHLYNKAVSVVLSKINSKFTIEYCTNFFDGKCWQDAFKELSINETFDTEQIFNDSIAIAKELIIQYATITNGTLEALQLLKKHNIPIAICSNSHIYEIQAILKQLNLKDFFLDHHIFGRELVKKGKPNPEIYLFACKQMNIHPKNAIAIEDSVSGATAGLNAEIQTVIFSGGTAFSGIKKFRTKFDKDLQFFSNMQDFATFVIQKHEQH